MQVHTQEDQFVQMVVTAFEVYAENCNREPVDVVRIEVAEDGNVQVEVIDKDARVRTVSIHVYEVRS